MQEKGSRVDSHGNILQGVAAMHMWGLNICPFTIGVQDRTGRASVGHGSSPKRSSGPSGLRIGSGECMS